MTIIRLPNVILAIFLMLPGCTLLNLRQETRQLEQVAEISGVVEGAVPENGKPIVVALLAVNPDQPDQAEAVLARTILLQPGPFTFFAGTGSYRVGAFVDIDENGAYQADEPAGWHDEPRLIQVADGRGISGLKVTLHPAHHVQRLYPEVREPGIADIADLSRRFAIGAETTLDNPAFTPENGRIAFWEPLRFLGLQASGIYLLESYDATKTPVLFIHGAGGQPGEWREVIGALDRRHFQPWVLFYPSGLRLDLNRQWVANGLGRLRQEYRFTTIHLVAHSMGGLLAGGIVERLADSGHGDLLGKLVTLATPWGGHELAATGVDNSPAVVPSWYDMVPGSPYQERVFSGPWPDRLDYHLLFSHRGGYNVMSGGNTDGVVSLKSQLLPAAQDRAVSIRGFDEDHTSILRSKAAIAHLMSIISPAVLPKIHPIAAD